MDLEVEHPGVKQSMLKALGNVMPRHLLDTAPQSERRAARQRRACGSKRNARPSRSSRSSTERCERSFKRVSSRTRRRACRGERVIGEIDRRPAGPCSASRSDDGAADVAYVAAKIRDLRVFEGEAGKPMDRSVVRQPAAACSWSRSSRCTATCARAAGLVR